MLAQSSRNVISGGLAVGGLICKGNLPCSGERRIFAILKYSNLQMSRVDKKG